MKTRVQRYIVSLITSFLLIVQSIAPYAVAIHAATPGVSAQTVTPTSTQTPTPTVIEPTLAEPTESVTPTSVTPTITEEVTPTVAVTPDANNVEEPTPGEDQSESEEPSQEENEVNEDVSAETEQNDSQETSEEEAFSAPTLSTDKDDYLPGQFVIVTGEGYVHDSSYAWQLTGSTGYTQNGHVSANSEGKVTFMIQLPFISIPSYDLILKNAVGESLIRFIQ